MFCSLVLIPAYSGFYLRRAIASTILEIMRIICEQGDAKSVLYSHYAPIARLSVEAKWEQFRLGRRNKEPFSFSNIIKSEQALYRLVDTVHILANARAGVNDPKLKEKIKRVTKLTAELIRFPRADVSSQECLIRVDAQWDAEEFVVHEFIRAWNSFLHALDPRLAYAISRAKSGMANDDAVRISFYSPK